MLTRLEVSGFKNLRASSIDFGPFTCIAGENGTGKSNLFDAIEFLSLLSSRSLMEAAQEIRSTRDGRSGDPRDLFWQDPATATRLMTFAVEMLLPRSVEDDFGRVAEASNTFVRYELDIGYKPPSGPENLGRLVLARESLTPIKFGLVPKRLGFPHSAKKFRKAVVTGNRAKGSFISTENSEGDKLVTVHQDGDSPGKPMPASAAQSPATAVCTTTSADYPTILASRQEMQSWRRLAIEPSALRTSDRYTDSTQMASDGRHLPATLLRVATRAAARGLDSEPSATYARIATRLSSLTGVGVRRVLVEADDTRELITLKLEGRNGVKLPARSISEGTLRLLALAVLLEDHDARGVVCMEEPENGIPPANLEATVNLLRDIAVDPRKPPGDDNPFRQVIVNTHSPALVQLLEPEELLFATAHESRDESGDISRVLRLAPLRGTWRQSRQDETPVTKADILLYLTTPPGSQLTLESFGGSS